MRLGGQQEARLWWCPLRVLAGALFVVCAGTDDIPNTYYTTPLWSAEYDIPAYVDLLLVGVESFLRNVSARGAKRIGFVGLPPIGCVPSQRTLSGGPHQSCVRGCCSPRTVEVAVLCDARFAPVCDDVSEHVFFDSYHPTQRAYKVIVDYIFDHYIQFLNL